MQETEGKSRGSDHLQPCGQSLLQSFYISRMIEATLLAGYRPIEKDQCFQTSIGTDLSADFKEVIYSGLE